MAPGGLVVIIKANGLKWMNANDVYKSIFDKRAKAKEWRFMAGVYARSHGVPQFNKAHVTAIIHRNSSGKADVLNWSDTVKPIIDGLTDVGCWPDDDNEHLTVDLRAGEMWPKSGVELIITPGGADRAQLDDYRKQWLRRARARKLRLRGGTVALPDGS